jgi:hypothetical protein
MQDSGPHPTFSEGDSNLGPSHEQHSDTLAQIDDTLPCVHRLLRVHQRADDPRSRTRQPIVQSYFAFSKANKQTAVGRDAELMVDCTEYDEP